MLEGYDNYSRVATKAVVAELLTPTGTIRFRGIPGTPEREIIFRRRDEMLVSLAPWGKPAFEVCRLECDDIEDWIAEAIAVVRTAQPTFGAIFAAAVRGEAMPPEPMKYEALRRICEENSDRGLHEQRAILRPRSILQQIEVRDGLVLRARGGMLAPPVVTPHTAVGDTAPPRALTGAMRTAATTCNRLALALLEEGLKSQNTRISKRRPSRDWCTVESDAPGWATQHQPELTRRWKRAGSEPAIGSGRRP